MASARGGLIRLVVRAGVFAGESLLLVLVALSFLTGIASGFAARLVWLARLAWSRGYERGHSWKQQGPDQKEA